MFFYVETRELLYYNENGYRVLKKNGVSYMGKVNVNVILKNYDDIAVINRGLMSPGKGREYHGEGLVDMGATMLTIPKNVFDQLGLRYSNREVTAI